LAYLMIIEGEELQTSAWKTIVDVLRVTEKDAIFHLTETDRYRVRMEQVGEAALGFLGRAWDGMSILDTNSFFCTQMMSYVIEIHILLWLHLHWTCILASSVCSLSSVSSFSHEFWSVLLRCVHILIPFVII
jgi:hypothetical protein